MSTTITNVTGLQDMEDDLDGDYVLGNDIDASATSGWNGGAGFYPVGRGANIYVYPRPTSDDDGYAGQSGSWTIYPNDGVYYDKVDEATSDADSTYIQATANNDQCLLAHDSSVLNIPDEATNIRVYLKVRLKNMGSGTSYIQGMMNIDGTEYMLGSNQSYSYQLWALKTWTVSTYPPDSSVWTPLSVFSLATAGIGVKVSDASPDVRITQIYLQIIYDHIFTGTFDGAGYTISDLYIDRDSEDENGLFGRADGATIQDVTLSSVNITGYDETGGLVGYAKNNTISDCHTTGTLHGSSYAYWLGGLLGRCDGDTITRCSSSCTITGTDDENDCNNYGGLIGESDDAIISKCYATGSVSVADDYVGGLIGEITDTDIDDCYARGDASGGESVGGLVGWASGGTIDNSFSTGTPTGSDYVNGLVGTTTTTVTNCFWDTETSGTESSDGGTGKTTANMKLIATFSTWDIGGDGIVRNNGYPYLHWETGKHVPIWMINTTSASTRSWTIPDLKDYKGRAIKNANVKAYRTDTHALVEEETTDANGSATFTDLPVDVGVVFHAMWGGGRIPKKRSRQRFI